jgi:hypothetical protein
MVRVDSFNNGAYPHYGIASSKFSENVAIKCGFEVINRLHYFNISPKA